jgi:hypothetical protein
LGQCLVENGNLCQNHPQQYRADTRRASCHWQIEKKRRRWASSQLAAFHNLTPKLSNLELHEITFNRAKAEAVFRRFSA